jgi:type I restriction enzyme M protein
MTRDKANLDIFQLSDKSFEDIDNVPDPDIITAEIVEDLESTFEQLRLIAEDLGNPDNETSF